MFTTQLPHHGIMELEKWTVIEKIADKVAVREAEGILAWRKVAGSENGMATDSEVTHPRL